mgnify:CR=1 FL=1
MLGIIFLLKKLKKADILPYNGIVYKKQTGKFYFKNKLIENLDELELRIMIYLIDNESRFVSLNELNRLFESGKSSETFASIVRRRELTLTGLLQKLSNLTNFPEKELIINRKNLVDKRIKEIKFPPSFIKINI